MYQGSFRTSISGGDGGDGDGVGVDGVGVGGAGVGGVGVGGSGGVGVGDCGSGGVGGGSRLVVVVVVQVSYRVRAPYTWAGRRLPAQV